MNFKTISNTELIERIEKLVRTERKIGHLVLLHISEIETRKIYAELGFDSMFSYLSRGLGYSESCAYRRLNSARLLKQIPEIAEKLVDGSLNLSQLTSVQKCLKADLKKSAVKYSDTNKPSELQTLNEFSNSTDSYNSSENHHPVKIKNSDSALIIEKTKLILSKIENKNTYETEQILSYEFQQPVVSIDSVKPQRDKSIRLEMTLTAEQYAELELARNFLSHTCPGGSWADIISVLAKKFNQSQKGKTTSDTSTSMEKKVYKKTNSIKQKDINIESINNKKDQDLDQNQTLSEKHNKTQNQIHFYTHLNPDHNQQNLTQKIEQSKILTPCLSKAAPKIKIQKLRELISAKIKKEIFAKANFQCEYHNRATGVRCHSRSFLEIDHCQPVSIGGTNEITNLRVLCKTHNLMAARNSGL